MHLISILAFTGAVSASAPLLAARPALGLMASGQVIERQLDICVPIPAPFTCERSCGPGFVECVGFPNCYNPGRGDSCCSNGRYCPAGSYCTNAGCCENGLSLEECGATVTLSVIPPPPVETPSPSQEPPSSDAESNPPEPTLEPTLEPTPEPTPEPSSSEPAEPTPEPSTPTSESEPATSAPTSETSRPPSNGTSSVPPPIPTAGAGRSADFGVVALLGVLVVLLIAP